MISANMPYKKSFKTINGKSIAFVDVGEGDPIVLLHGNPTSSYLWRNVIPHLEGMGRVIAPDLIGQGDSDKLPASDGPDRYSFQVAYDYLAGLLDELDANQNVTLVIHDWGSALGFYWGQSATVPQILDHTGPLRLRRRDVICIGNSCWRRPTRLTM